VNIPALHYFTGTHHDYHKPSDDEDKINYDGIYKVISHIYLMNEALAKSKVLTFQKTKEDTATKVSFKVTLGIMPDYLYDGAGVMVDGVTPERPAAKSGIIKGDCVIQLGDIKITDMQSYMKALSQFSKGQQTTVSVLRAGKEIVMNLTF
jgi:C-terminal processing protease CtpA/Prc